MLNNNFKNHLTENFPELKNLIASKSDYIIRTINDCIHGKLRHKDCQDKFYLPSTILLSNLGNNYQQTINPYFISQNNSYDRWNDTTLIYDFTDRLKLVLQSYEPNKQKNIIKNDNNKEIKTEPKNTVFSKDSNNIPVKNKIQLNNNIVYINSELCEQALTYINSISQYAGSHLAYNKTFNPKNELISDSDLINKKVLLSNLIDNANNRNFLLPGIIMQYVQAQSGRLYAVENGNLQQLPSELMKIALSNIGNYDYDIRNCNYSILLNIAKQLKVDSLFTTIKYYVDNTSEFREFLTQKTKIKKSIIKQILLAIVYGGCSNINSKSLKKLVPEFNCRAKLFQCQEFQNLRIELKVLTTELKKRIGKTKDKQYYLNIQNKTISIKSKKSEIIAHLLQGYDSYILDLVVKSHPEVVLLMFDGWISNKINLSEIYKEIKDKLGFDISIEEKELTFNKI